MQHLFTVADCFELQKRGCVLVPGPSGEPEAPILTRGDKIQLRTPRGKHIDTFIKEFEMINYRKSSEKVSIPILLPKDITKDQVPIGTEVFLHEKRSETSG